MNLLMLDNYDSFTYNLVQYLREIPDCKVSVYRNDAIDLVKVANYDAVILSPGPGLPKDAGIMPDLIKTYAGKLPILGVCLGHQAIAEAFGGRLLNLSKVYHGIATDIQVTDPGHPLFENLPTHFPVGRYHSWVVDPEALPDCLGITSIDEAGQIMSLSHKHFPVYGVQFHPESILSENGRAVLANFIKTVLVQGAGYKVQG